MYVPPHFAIHDVEQIAGFVDAMGAADIVTFDGEQLISSLVPIIWDRSSGGHGRLIAHLSWANGQWQTTRPDLPALAIVHGPQAYISPSWYPSKREHGRAVPTWNYVAVHFSGRVAFHPEPEWVLDVVTRLTDKYEAERADRWHVTDAPPRFIDGQLREIVGVELLIEHIEAKAKLSQNRADADQAGAVAGLRDEASAGAGDVAELMERRAFS
jgi:transcriptional regulator